VEHWKDKEPEVKPTHNPHDRISNLIFNVGHSDKPETNASSPNATPMDRNTALIEQALEQMFRPKPTPTHEIVEVNHTALEPFRYSPLKEKRSIRLLHFHEDEYSIQLSGGKQHICTMDTFPLDEAPAYLILSYSWESPRNAQASLKEYQEHRNWIIREHDGRHCLAIIRRNLYEALQRITTSVSQTRYIWCINQEDNVERGTQVSIMGEIYSLCTRVIIWLGIMDPYEASHVWNLHFQLVPEIPKYIAKHGADSIKTGDWTEEGLRERFNISEQALGPKHWTAYKRPFSKMR
tara:strand:+ start:3330 stop:4208 length:879 start_codon:yes stop_codon:yes gene_type:complete